MNKQLPVLLFLAVLAPERIVAWTSSSAGARRRLSLLRPSRVVYTPPTITTTRLHNSASDSSATTTELAVMQDFSDQELQLVQSIVDQAAAAAGTNQVGEDNNHSSVEHVLRNTLSTLHPSLIIKLRQAQQHDNPSIKRVSQALNNLLHQQLEQAKQTLTSLLTAGEIRKLDALIGKAARDKQLDVAFFNVLSTNLKDAIQQEQQQQQDKSSSPSLTQSPSSTETPASRAQILQHIYTRCQEEVEKTIPPGTALLNKLLRTEQPSIRVNLYKHYLTTDDDNKKTISTPNGQTIQLAQPRALVSLLEFIDAMAMAVQQIRTVETAGGTDRVTAAAMVESCRMVAKEARSVIAESYGMDSAELKGLEEGLQPVFRPDSPNSPYIKGES